MTDPIGTRIWSEFTRLRDTSSDGVRRFGELPVETILHAGDGGTFRCHVNEHVKKGTWRLYRFGLEDLGAVIAVHENSQPIRWEFANGIIIDSGLGAFVPKATLDELDLMDDSDELIDAIDEAIFGSDDDVAILKTPEGQPFAVFQLAGDGTYNVFKGIDSDGVVCALAVAE